MHVILPKQGQHFLWLFSEHGVLGDVEELWRIGDSGLRKFFSVLLLDCLNDRSYIYFVDSVYNEFRKLIMKSDFIIEKEKGLLTLKVVGI